MAAPELSQLASTERTVVLLLEAQRGVIGDDSALPELAEATRSSGAARNMGRLAVAARQAGVQVVHCTAEHLPGGFGKNRNARLFAGASRAGVANTSGTSSVQPIPEVGPETGDIVLPRYHGLSPMTGGPLDSLLRNQGVTTIVVAGVSLNVAVPNLVFDAVNRAYQVVLVTDAVAGVPQEYAEQVIQYTLALVATLTTTNDLIAVWS
jgi:nicotinamidase-related amidase